MKNRIVQILIICLGNACCYAQPEIKFPETLFKLPGIWYMNVKNGTLYETWNQINETTFSGQGFKVNENGDTIITEHIRVIIKGSDVFYVPAVTDQNEGKAVEFRLVKQKKDILVFENKTHDFPQQIIYHFKDSTHLDVVIEGKTSEGFRSVPFSFTRK